MFPTLLAQAMRLAVVSAGGGPLAAVLVPALAHVIATRRIRFSLTIG